MTTYLVVIFLLLILAGWLLLRRAGAQQQQAGLPQGRIVYTDTGAWNRVEDPLFCMVSSSNCSRRHLLTGKPDYLVEQNGHLIPVEVKPNRSSSQPYDSDVLRQGRAGPSTRRGDRPVTAGRLTRSTMLPPKEHARGNLYRSPRACLMSLRGEMQEQPQ